MAKYSAEQLRQMLAKGQAMRNPSGDPSYPIADSEDLGNAIHAVGLGGAANNSIRRYIMGRARALGKTSMIPDTWQADGSLRQSRALRRTTDRSCSMTSLFGRAVTGAPSRRTRRYSTIRCRSRITMASTSRSLTGRVSIGLSRGQHSPAGRCR